MLPEIQTEPCRAACRTCARLRRATAETVAEAGVAGLTPGALATATGLTEAEVVRHARDLDALVATTYAEVTAWLNESFGRDLWVAPTWDEGFGRALARHVRRVAAEPALARFCYVGIRDGDTTLDRVRAQARADGVAMLARYHRAVAARDVPALAHFELVVGAVDHLIENHVRTGTLDALPAELPRLVSAFSPDAARFAG